MQQENTTTAAQTAQHLLNELLANDNPNGFQSTLHQFLGLAFTTEENLSQQERDYLYGNYTALINFFEQLKQLNN